MANLKNNIPVFRKVGERMKIVNKVNRIIVKFEEFLIAASVIVMSLVLIGNVLGRMFHGKGIYATEEIGQYCIYIITFIGLSYAVTTGKHINMLGLFDMTPPKFQKVVGVIIAVVTGATMIAMTVISLQYVQTLKMMGKVSVNLQIPTYIIVAVISMGFLFAALQYVLIFIKNIKNEEVYLGLEKPYVPDFRREEKE